jgi:hydrogenase maturation factor
MMRQRLMSVSSEVMPGDSVEITPSGDWVHVHIGHRMHLFGEKDAMAETLSDALSQVQASMDNEEANG